MDDFDLMIKEIMIQRKPEFWLNDIFSNLTEYNHYKYPSIIFYKKDDDLLFDYDKKTDNFYFDYDKIWYVLSKKYHCNNIKIEELILNMVRVHLKLSVVNSPICTYLSTNAVKEYLDLGVNVKCRRIY